LNSVTQQSVEGTAVTTERIPKKRPSVAVFQALAKGGKADGIIQRLVEVGVDEVVIFTSGRSVPDWEPNKGDRMVQRWEAIAVGAAKQSHRAWLPVIRGPLSFEDLLAGISPPALVGVPDAGVSLRAALPSDPEQVSIIVGPEGGLAPEEVSSLEGSGAVAVSLGPQILRTETAALVLTTAVMYHYNRLG